MKKTFIAIVAALAMLIPASLRAEEAAKEYNMVITLQNGTTITLGHNDIKNITFNGEEIEISGNVVNTIEEINQKVDEAFMRTSDLENYIDGRSAMLQEQIYQAQDYMNSLNQDLQIHVAELVNKTDATEAELHQLQDYVEYINNRTELNEQRLNDIETTLNEIRNLVYEIANRIGL